MADKLVLPLGLSLSSDIEVRTDRATPFRARVRWVDPVTKKRSSKSEAFETRDAAVDWVTRMGRAAARGVDPNIATTTLFDPFFGVFFPAAVPANAVLGSFTQNKGGLNIGAGVSVRVKGDSNTKFFAETRYHYMFTTPQATTVLPVTFGLRW